MSYTHKYSTADVAHGTGQCTHVCARAEPALPVRCPPVPTPGTIARFSRRAHFCFFGFAFFGLLPSPGA